MLFDDSSSDLIRIKDFLNKNKIKLWLDPFYSDESGTNEDEMKDLARRYSNELCLSYESCLDCLLTLQTKALGNIRDRNKFQTTGLATLKVRVPTKCGKAESITVTLELNNTGNILIEKIAKQISVPVERLRLIHQGKFLKETETLLSQQITHGRQIMAVIMGDKSNSQTQVSKYIDSTKTDVKLLAKKDYYLQVSDQTGKLLDIPTNEKKALILAMALHEKGRVAMKNKDFSLALVMLLEAEKEFSCCNSNLLKTVDNHGILNLDIVWCYLNLESIKQLPDAEERLRQCELSFHHSYGADLERLIVLKGSAVNEKALFLRLHLLQSIILYHQNKFDDAKKLLERAEQELKFLEVNDDQLAQIVELGYTATEARLALRESQGNMNTAVNIIEAKRQKKKEIKEAIEKERKLKREKEKLRKCIDGKGRSTDDSEPSTSKMKHEEAYKRLSEGMSTHEEDHLDLNLVLDTMFLLKYKELLSEKLNPSERLH